MASADPKLTSLALIGALVCVILWVMMFIHNPMLAMVLLLAPLLRLAWSIITDK